MNPYPADNIPIPAITRKQVVNRIIEHRQLSMGRMDLAKKLKELNQIKSQQEDDHNREEMRFDYKVSKLAAEGKRDEIRDFIGAHHIGQEIIAEYYKYRIYQQQAEIDDIINEAINEEI